MSNNQSGVAAIRVGDCDMPVPSTPEEFRILLEDPYVMRVESLGYAGVPRAFLPRTLLGDYVDLYTYTGSSVRKKRKGVEVPVIAQRGS